jgi:hypothetical protein
MKRKPRRPADPAEVLREAAIEYPDAEEGVACEGTALEKRTVKVRKKAFLFLSANDAMFKLRDSLDEAEELAESEPDRYKPGAHGWVTVTFGDIGTLPTDRLLNWLDESYRLFAPKQLLSKLPARGKETT